MSWVAWEKLTKPKFAGGLGFKDVEAFNDAFLAKIGWRILNNPESLLAKILLGKYCHASSFMECSSPSSASHGWRGILIGRDLLRKGLGWAIGDGRKVRIWQDPWLSLDQPLAPMGPPTLASSTMLVHDLLCPISKEWNLEVIRNHLPQYEENICSIITSNFQLKDSLVWLPEKSGIYSTKTGYHLAREAPRQEYYSPQDFNWNKNIWNVKAAPKVKNFLWKASCGALSLGNNLAKRGLLANLNCKRCGEREDELHIFLNCDFARRIWNSAPVFPQITAGTFQNFHSFLPKALLVSALPPIGLVTSPIAPWLLWNLWKARNSLIFEDRHYSEQDIITKTIREAREWQAAQTVVQKQQAIPRRTVVQQVNEDSFKCFVDAAWSATTRVCGQGWILFDPAGNALARFKNSRLCVASALTAEALALRSALVSLKSNTELSIRRLEVFSDSQVLISILNSKASSKELKAIINDITQLSVSFPSVSFSYVPRLDNVAADSLAKAALFTAISFSPCGV
ncbi:Ribonuclease H-like superfamily [Arabidopsis thaliana x Arabidopsis arenosa]|uniref:Ribonuclease H-like superfamily n=1 Tax=Arabidopsis thaliana x Arabidopsis arenosa TaxID=1240361 RepID=A0A8T2A8J6_9BRAS|nr:Ribonuclease H-like superfamily [Arabidopsis thaliana x Arabidopsis arenosa]